MIAFAFVADWLTVDYIILSVDCSNCSIFSCLEIAIGCARVCAYMRCVCVCVANEENIRFLLPITIYFVIEMPQSPGIL